MKKIKIGDAIKIGLIKNQGAYITSPISEDLNSLLSYGDYIILSSTPNTPISESGVLWVRPFGAVSIGGRVVQEFMSNSGRRFFRFKFISSQFSQWKEI